MPELPHQPRAASRAVAFRVPLQGFELGVSSSGYQFEGGYNGTAQPQNNWAEWEALSHHDVVGDGARGWDLHHEDLERCRALGLTTLRLSVEWARVQPSTSRERFAQAPAFDTVAIASYAARIKAAQDAGLEVVVALCHFTYPRWLGLDFWTEPDAPQRFAAYVEAMLPLLQGALKELGARPVLRYFTLTEPNATPIASYLAAALPSALTGAAKLAALMPAFDGMFASHVLAYAALRRVHDELGLAPPTTTYASYLLDAWVADRQFADVLACRAKGVDPSDDRRLAAYLESSRRAHDKALEPLVAGNRASIPRRAFGTMLQQAAEAIVAPSRLPRLRAALARSPWAVPLDLMAVDYYDPYLSHQTRLPGEGLYEPWDWAVRPEGLYHCLKSYASLGLPLLVAENGMAVRRHLGKPADPRPDGIRRDDFIRAHVYEVLRARTDGVNVIGYLHWSLTDNYEWGRFAPRFGLYGVDYDDPARRRLDTDAAGVDAASAYGAIARAVRSGDREALARALGGT